MTLLWQVAVLLAVALLLGRLGMRLGWPALVGELLAGVLLAPLWSFGTDGTTLASFAQWCVVMVVGTIGSHLDVTALRRRPRAVAFVSAGGLLVPLGMGLGLGFLLAEPGTTRITFAFFIGVAMCVSAIPVMVKTFTDMGLMWHPVSQLTLAAGAVNDVVGWLLLAALTTGLFPRAVPLTLLFLGLMAAVVWPLLRWVMRRVTEVLPAAVVFIVGGAALADLCELEPVFGAFLIGIMIGRVIDPERLSALRSFVLLVCAPLFLATAGLRMDLGSLVTGGWLPALAMLAVAIVGKFSGAYLGARLAGLSPWEGLAIGAGLNARGIIEVVIATAGLQAGIIGPAIYNGIILVAVVTSLLAPPVLQVGHRRLAPAAPVSDRPVPRASHCVADGD